MYSMKNSRREKQRSHSKMRKKSMTASLVSAVEVEVDPVYPCIGAESCTLLKLEVPMLLSTR